ncbi:MAG: FAD-binding and (Fe-S)-binding domain-containing protein [Fidelibacterota bacterium]
MNSLSAFLPESCIHDDLITRLAYTRDASMYRLIPEAVVRPKDEQEVRSLLEYARSSSTPITFRTAGTSLSGQSITTGIIAEVLYDWQKFKILDDGDAIWCQPGVNGAVANKILAPYQRRIGPDPASINAARIGGIVSNNSSGMVCGTEFNAYHTLKDVEFILPNGNGYDTSKPGERGNFLQNEPNLATGLLNIKTEIESNSSWVRKIREKYRIKNTIGYSMNSFLDYKHPLDIFSHLLVGGEGTLAFIANVTLKTIPDPPEKGTGLLLFNSPESAAKCVPFFKSMGASAIEFLDDESLRTAQHFENPPYDPNSVEDDVTGLLIEYQDDSQNEIDRLIKESKEFSQKESSVISMKLVTDQQERETIWKIRKGLYPTLGSLRKTGTSIITEDIAVDAVNLAQAIRGLKNIFQKREFQDGVIFGHAKDGNLHFITSVDLDDKIGVRNYEGMMRDLSDMTLTQFNGSLKAEHGTGRNMAAFVETEWGGPLYEIMWKVKSLTDPFNIMNPDVLLSRNKQIHMNDLKPMPTVHDEVDKCIECGFCERICPSRGLTLTPRQRIAVMRESKLQTIPKSDIDKFNYAVNETCATDGLCELECPVNINTGTMVKSLRHDPNSKFVIVKFLENNFRIAVSFIRFGLRIGQFFDKIFGSTFLWKFTRSINSIFKTTLPSWPKYGIKIAKTFSPVSSPSAQPDYIVFPSCASRVLAADETGTSASEYLAKIATNADIKIKYLDDSSELCCGMAFDSQGHKSIGDDMRIKLMNRLRNESEMGRIPIVLDMSPCTQFVQQELSDLTILDSAQFIERIKDQLEIEQSAEPIFVHPVCSSQKMGTTHDLMNLANMCSKSVETTLEPFCCGTGGDRSIRFPELPQNAVDQLMDKIISTKGVSSSRTCELGLQESTGIAFSSIEALVYDAIKK